MVDDERWKWIKGYEGRYQISSKGRVKSFLKDKRGYILKTDNRVNYLTFSPSSPSNRKTIRIHRLVYETFVGEIPPNHVIHHIDENKHNNCIENLALMDGNEHTRMTVSLHPEIYKCLNNRNKYGQRHIVQYTTDGFFIAEYANASIASKATGVCGRNILQVANKTEYKPNMIRSQAGGFCWKFADEKGGD